MTALAIAAVGCNAQSESPANATAEHQGEIPAHLSEDHSVALVKTPKSMNTEHGKIHGALIAATEAPGEVGEAAKKLAEVLHAHFVREEEIALPPLGLLEALATGGTIDPKARAEALRMSSELKAELPKMLKEHVEIRSATEKLRAVAKSANNAAVVEFAEDLALHAETEEKVMYPAAILVGELLRGR